MSSALPAGTLAALAPRGRVRMGFVGLGEMGRANLSAFLALSDVEVVAVCDEDPRRASAALAWAHHLGARACRDYTDARRLLDGEALDALALSLPGRAQTPLAVLAAGRGLDLYGERPLSGTIEDGRAMVDAVERGHRVWQSGHWRRSRPAVRQVCERIREGLLGAVHRVEIGLPQRVASGGDRRSQDRNASAGAFVAWASEEVELAHWALGLGHTGPLRVEAAASSPAPHGHVVCTYAGGLCLELADDGRFARGLAWHGERGWLRLSRGGLWGSSAELLRAARTSVQPSGFSEHHRDFVECVKTRRPARASIEEAHRANTVALLGERALRTGRPLRWDPDAELLLGDVSASASPAVRSPC